VPKFKESMLKRSASANPNAVFQNKKKELLKIEKKIVKDLRATFKMPIFTNGPTKDLFDKSSISPAKDSMGSLPDVSEIQIISGAKELVPNFSIDTSMI
jgi:hypothetical protein